MTSELGEIVIYPSINSARIAFKIRFNTVKLCLESGQPIIKDGIKWFISAPKTGADK